MGYNKPNDWLEDAAHENGNYANECSKCGSMFRGHKRRAICKLCQDDALHGYRFDVPLNSFYRSIPASIAALKPTIYLVERCRRAEADALKWRKIALGYKYGNQWQREDFMPDFSDLLTGETVEQCLNEVKAPK